MENKKMKKNKTNNHILTTIRVSMETKKRAEGFRSLIKQNIELPQKNKKRSKISLDQIILFGLNLITEKELEILRKKSLSPTDRQNILYKKYCDLNGPIPLEDYIGFTQTLAYADFLKEHIELLKIP